MNLYLIPNTLRLHNDATLPFALGALQRLGRESTTPLNITLNDDPEGAIGCVLRSRWNGALYLAGTRRQGAEITDRLPPRLYRNAHAMAMALVNLELLLADFQIEYAHEKKDE